MGRSDSRVLVVYWNPYGRRLRHSTLTHLNAVCRVAPAGSVLAVNAHGGAPPMLRHVKFSAVILHTTFLAARWVRPFEAWRQRSSWIGELECVKLALPQDDFDHSAVLDEWLESLGVTSVFTALPDRIELLYQRTRRQAEFHGVLTGYLDSSEKPASPPTVERGLDVIYRAARLPYWYGRLGLLKGVIADAASESAARLSLQNDISVLPHDVVTGARWLAFLRSGKTVVGAESGSSVIDPDGRVRRGVSALLALEPELSYEEVTHRLGDLADWDRHWCAVVSPRHLEAAFTRTVQVLVEGRYSGVLQAGKHYVPIRPDLSDLDDALLHALDPSVAAPMADEAFAEIVESGRYNAERLTEVLAAAIPDRPTGSGTPDPMFAALRGAARLGDLAVAGRGRLATLRRRRAN